MYIHVYKCIYSKMLTQTHGAWKSHLYKPFSFRFPCRLYRTSKVVNANWYFSFGGFDCGFRSRENDWRTERIANYFTELQAKFHLVDQFFKNSKMRRLCARYYNLCIYFFEWAKYITSGARVIISSVFYI